MPNREVTRFVRVFLYQNYGESRGLASANAPCFHISPPVSILNLYPFLDTSVNLLLLEGSLHAPEYLERICDYGVC